MNELFVPIPTERRSENLSSNATPQEYAAIKKLCEEHHFSIVAVVREAVIALVASPHPLTTILDNRHNFERNRAKIYAKAGAAQ